MSLNQKLKLVLKTLLGLGLVVWVLKGKMVDFSLLKNLILNPLNLLVALLFLGASAFLCTSRWLILVRGQGLQLSFRDLFSLNMIGNFFNTFMPGSVGGDLIKAWYVAGKQPNKRTEAVFTVLLDRVLGLSVIIFYAAFTLVVFSHWLNGRSELKAIAICVWSFTLFSIAAGLLFFCTNFFKSTFSEKLMCYLRRSKKLSRVLDATFLYQDQPKQIFKAVFLSALSIFVSIYFHFLQGQSINAPLSLVQYFAIVPLALIASAVPLLPGGIGTGQVAFYTLFKWSGISNPELGGTLCTLVQIYTISFNCLGYFFYLRFKKLPAALGSSI
ncbi:MAG: UPF0104 family protein [Proteobacteria bacterium]|nr:UPF0104 family protein [Pseudomonadota bacterium]